MAKTPIFSIILIESALELITSPSKKRKNLKKGKKSSENSLLDVSIHNHLMQNMKDRNKRGRPDIIHTALLLALGSRLNIEGYMRIFVQTRNDEIITVKPEVRIPRNYARFKGLMEQLFQVKKIPPKSSEILITLENQSLEDFFHHLNPDIIILFTEEGIISSDNHLQKVFASNNSIAILIGGFPHGDFSDIIMKFPDMKVSIYPRALDTLTTLSYVIHIAERSIDV